MTAIDLAVAAGLAEIGDPGRVRPLERAFVRAVLDRVQETIEEVVARMLVTIPAGGVLGEVRYVNGAFRWVT